MGFELVDNGSTLQYFGNVFAKEIITEKPIIVDGDLIANYVMAPSVTVKNGSLIAPYVEVPTLHADILGVFDLTKPFEAPDRWTYTWLRPCTMPLPVEDEWASEITIERVVRSFLHPAIVIDTALVERLMAKIRARPSCGRSRVLFQVAAEELMDNPSALTPLGQQIGALLLSQPRLPRNWRY